MSSTFGEEVRDDVWDAVADFCVGVIKEPLSHFSEADLQQLLAETLRKIPKLADDRPTGVPRGQGAKTTYRTSLIHREYGGGEGTRIDVVVLDPADVEKIPTPSLTDDQRHYLKPVFAFELGTEKSADTAGHLKGDIEKLRNASVQTQGCIIHMYRDVGASGRESERREKTQDKILREFKQPFESAFADPNIPAHIAMIPILLHTSQGVDNPRGKCEILHCKEWEKINVGNEGYIRDAILRCRSARAGG
jgi:hypothetical protein